MRPGGNVQSGRQPLSQTTSRLVLIQGKSGRAIPWRSTLIKSFEATRIAAHSHNIATKVGTPRIPLLRTLREFSIHWAWNQCWNRETLSALAIQGVETLSASWQENTKARTPIPRQNCLAEDLYRVLENTPNKEATPSHPIRVHALAGESPVSLAQAFGTNPLTAAFSPLSLQNTQFTPLKKRLPHPIQQKVIGPNLHSHAFLTDYSQTTQYLSTGCTQRLHSPYAGCKQPIHSHCSVWKQDFNSFPNGYAQFVHRFNTC